MAKTATYWVVNASNIEKDLNGISSPHSFWCGECRYFRKDQLYWQCKVPRAGSSNCNHMNSGKTWKKWYTYFERGTFAGCDNVIVQQSGYTTGFSEVLNCFLTTSNADKVWDGLF